ncbi:MAG: hypothetical protein IJT88_09190 [Kiritimatiellae bacterium]|nr:hypothetical protein [Kiritimatiellia bacterium]MBQ9345371.1 hypothetical protein [Kiritimatiellia bacterium]
MKFGLPSPSYVPTIRTGIGKIQFFCPRFFFMVGSLLMPAQRRAGCPIFPVAPLRIKANLSPDID